MTDFEKADNVLMDAEGKLLDVYKAIHPVAYGQDLHFTANDVERLRWTCRSIITDVTMILQEAAAIMDHVVTAREN